jgi:hypothetical protein
MKLKHTFITILGVCLGALVSGTTHAALVYDNGPINGTINAWRVDSGFSVSDSFTVSSQTSLTSAQIGLWVTPGAIPISVQWSFGTTAFASDISSGTSVLVNAPAGQSLFYDLYRSDLLISGLLSAGSYWFTLQNAAGSTGDGIYWDENDGPSSAQFDTPIGGGELPGSESFQLYGETAPVPEPSTCIAGALLLLPFGLQGIRRLTSGKRTS